MSRLTFFIQSIKGQLVIITVTVQALLMGIFVYDFIQRENNATYQNALLQERSLSELAASNLSNPLLNHDLIALQEPLHQISHLSDVELAFVCDNDFRIMASTDERYFNQKLNDVASVSLQKKWKEGGGQTVQLEHDGVLDTCAPIKIGEKVIGHFRIISSTERLEAQHATLIRWGMAYIVFATALGGIIAWLFIRKLTSRITLLSRVATQVSRENYNFDFKPFRGNDELSTMSQAFSKMIHSIHDQLIELNAEIEQRKKTEALLEYQAHHDELTRLCNRPLFLDRLDHALKKAKRQNEQLAVLFIDLDRFKEINDSLGHLIGDLVLIEVAERLRNTLREVDTIARLGGDEFTLILEEISEMGQIDEIAEKLVHTLQEPFFIEENIFFVTCSIGISIYPLDGVNPQSLLRNADSAMYKAKEEGRNSFQYYTEELTQKAVDRLALESNLRQAVANQEFIVYYQPQMDGERDEMIGMEALVRWKHPQMGMISPAEFIPLAEETGIILAIDAFVMRTAITQVVQWRKKGYKTGVLSLNLAMKQLWQEHFDDQLQALLEECECKPEWIELEVTEGEMMKNPEKAIEILQKLHSVGVLLAIDDFGTGYSSLAYLKRLPLDILKIDQSFVRGLPTNREDVAIVRSTIALAKSMGMEVIAEGVETKEQKEFLVENGCLRIQGYYYSRPISLEEMEERFEAIG
jgi:diguanylate cyclase (GGDEF)-like protein